MDEWEKYELHHRKRLAIKPGLDELPQVFNILKGDILSWTGNGIKLYS